MTRTTGICRLRVSGNLHQDYVTRELHGADGRIVAPDKTRCVDIVSMRPSVS